MEFENIVMNIIIYAGEAKAYAYEALQKTKEGSYEEIEALIEKSNEAVGKAHSMQTSLLQQEASGNKLGFSILLVHAQDHLMTAISEKNLINEIIELRKVVNTLINK